MPSLRAGSSPYFSPDYAPIAFTLLSFFFAFLHLGLERPSHLAAGKLLIGFVFKHHGFQFVHQDLSHFFERQDGE